jgi:hypothetical protein
MTEVERKKRRDKWDSEPYMDPDWVRDAAYLYNSVRTILEDSGWTMQGGEFRGWTHPDHCGSHSLGAAHGQWRLDVEREKYERNRKEPWSFYFNKDNRCYKHQYLLLTDDGDVGWCPSCVRYAHNRALDHGFDQEDPNGKPLGKLFAPDNDACTHCTHCNKHLDEHNESRECPE